MRPPVDYFTDAVLRAPTIGSMLMCLAASLVGVVVFLRRESLLGESLSHAAYPGVIIGVLIVAAIGGLSTGALTIAACVLTGAFITSYLGLCCINGLQRWCRIHADSALCFVLATFMGIGLTTASHVQFTHAALYRQAEAYLFGQAATMIDTHIYMYASLVAATVLTILALYKELQTVTFDREYATTTGINVQRMDIALFTLVVLAVVLGLRSVGVVLMSAMLIAPPTAARQLTNRLPVMFLISGAIGLFAGFCGNYLSVELSDYFEAQNPGLRLALPTGPMIVVVAASVSILALLFSAERGLVRRLLRAARFRYQCICENILKSLWRFGPKHAATLDELAKYQSVSRLYLRLVIVRLTAYGWVVRLRDGRYRLNRDGRRRAAHIVRLHRLWEVYLADHLGLGIERVHRNAEEMEHIITPELEERLTGLLADPKEDPHHQPIPPKQEL